MIAAALVAAACVGAADAPDLCTNYFGFGNGPEAHGLARPAVTRIFPAPIRYGGQSHLLTVSYEALDQTTFDAELEHAQRMIKNDSDAGRGGHQMTRSGAFVTA